jgi:acetyltransferase-like isoleucine patch superfamily enzyme
MTCCAKKPCLAAEKLRAWLAAGAEKRLTLRPADFEDEEFSLTSLLLTGPLSEQLAQRWRSFCAYLGQFTPFVGWKIFWYRRAGVSIGEHVYIAPGAVLDLLFPQLIRLDDYAVLGMEAMVMAHLYTPDRIAIGRATVGRRAVVGGRATLGLTSIGEEGVLATNSYTINPILDGQTGIGVPAVMRTRKSPRRGGFSHDERS